MSFLQNKKLTLPLLCALVFAGLVGGATLSFARGGLETYTGQSWRDGVPGVFTERNVYGPTIRVGLWSYTRDQSRDTSIRIEAKNAPYAVNDHNGTRIAVIPANVITRVKYDGSGTLHVYDDGNTIDQHVDGDVFFEAANAADKFNIIFDVHKPNSSFDDYRTGVQVHYDDNAQNIWAINRLPLEHYVWGMGEITGTGPMEYNKAMTSVYRSYGYYKIYYSTEHKSKGFDTVPDPSDQINYGYVWETTYPRIKQAADATRGHLVMYGGEPILTPYSSWTDGRTRSFQERWGSTLYPWCQSVSDPYGKHPTKSTAQLEAEGNHMVGISAHGALSLASDHGKNWTTILNYYLSGITISRLY